VLVVGQPQHDSYLLAFFEGGSSTWCIGSTIGKILLLGVLSSLLFGEFVDNIVVVFLFVVTFFFFNLNFSFAFFINADKSFFL
jgi:hypothetical protein